MKTLKLRQKITENLLCYCPQLPTLQPLVADDKLTLPYCGSIFCYQQIKQLKVILLSSKVVDCEVHRGLSHLILIIHRLKGITH